MPAKQTMLANNAPKPAKGRGKAKREGDQETQGRGKKNKLEAGGSATADENPDPAVATVGGSASVADDVATTVAPASPPLPQGQTTKLKALAANICFQEFPHPPRARPRLSLNLRLSPRRPPLRVRPRRPMQRRLQLERLSPQRRKPRPLNPAPKPALARLSPSP